MRSFDTGTNADPKALVLDIDGVLTDGTDPVSGGERSLFLRDLDALARIRREGVVVAFLTGESEDVAGPLIARCGGGTAVFDAKDKKEGIRELARVLGVPLKGICFIGDADRDAAAMNLVGLALAPADASPRARAAADRVLVAGGGRGAVEEAVALVFEKPQIEAAELSTAIRMELESIARAMAILAAGEMDILADVTATLARCLRSNGKVIVFGNGGSAAIAQHFAAELVGRFSRERGPIPALALTTDTSVLTAIANDFGFDSVFERQVAVAARFGDAVVGMSTSGSSKNVARGLAKARELGARTIAMVGQVAGVVGAEAEMCVTMPDSDPARVQEHHLAVLHVVCRQLDAIDLGTRHEDDQRE